MFSKLRNLMIGLIIMVIVTGFSGTIPTNAAPLSDDALTSNFSKNTESGSDKVSSLVSPTLGVDEATNGILTIQIFSTGQYTIRTGASHPVPDTNIFYPTETSFDSIKSITSGTVYVNDFVSDGSTFLGDSTIELIGTTGFKITNVITSPDSLTIEKTVNIIGTTLADSYVQVDTKIINNGASTTALAVRYLWDYELGSDDGPTFRAKNPDDSTLFLAKDYPSPSFESYDIQSNLYQDDLVVSGTSIGPSTFSPTTPDRISYVPWQSSKDTSFDYTVIPNDNINSDSAVLYYFGINSPLSVLPSNSITISESVYGSAATTAGQLNGKIWSDTNANGVIDSGELGILNESACIDRVDSLLNVVETLSCAETQSDGTYSINNLLSGYYKIYIFIPPGKIQTLPANGAPYYVLVESGQVVNDINFGEADGVTGQISGNLWNDANSNGSIDNGESGIPNISVCIEQGGSCTTTDSSGNYVFSNISTGQYTVYVGHTANLVNTTADFQQVTITSGLTVNNVNFGFNAPSPPPSEVTVPDSFGTSSGGLPTVYWGSSTTYTKNVGPTGFDHCGANKPVAINLVIDMPETGGQFSQMMTQTDTVNEIWSATFPPFSPHHGVANLKFYVDCPPDTSGFPEDITLIAGDDETQSAGNIYIDPSGTITDSCTNSPISGATVTLLKESPPGTGNYITPATSDHDPTINPQTTGTDGSYGWGVIPGTWKVSASHTGYLTSESAPLSIPPAVTDLTISLTPTSGCTTVNIPVITSPTENAIVTTNAITLTGTSDPNVTIEILHGTTSLGTATADVNGSWSFNTTLVDSTYTLTATATNGQNTSDMSNPLNITVNTTGFTFTSWAQGVIDLRAAKSQSFQDTFPITSESEINRLLAWAGNPTVQTNNPTLDEFGHMYSPIKRWNERTDLQNGFPTASLGADMVPLLIWSGRDNVLANSFNSDLVPHAATYKLLRIYFLERDDLRNNSVYDGADDGSDPSRLYCFAANSADTRLTPHQSFYAANCVL